MKVKFIDSTNSYILGSYKDMSGSLSIMSSGGAIIKGNEYRNQGFRTSLIDTIEQEGDTLTVKTLNSVYTFEVLKGSVDDLNLSPIEENRGDIEKFKELNAQKHMNYYCQITGNPLIDLAISVTKLPYEMDRKEALEYIKTNTILSVSGDRVVNIMTAVDDDDH